MIHQQDCAWERDLPCDCKPYQNTKSNEEIVQVINTECCEHCDDGKCDTCVEIYFKEVLQEKDSQIKRLEEINRLWVEDSKKDHRIKYEQQQEIDKLQSTQEGLVDALKKIVNTERVYGLKDACNFQDIALSALKKLDPGEFNNFTVEEK
jgi:hypothetical protein